MVFLIQSVSKVRINHYPGKVTRVLAIIACKPDEVEDHVGWKEIVKRVGRMNLQVIPFPYGEDYGAESSQTWVDIGMQADEWHG